MKKSGMTILAGATVVVAAAAVLAVRGRDASSSASEEGGVLFPALAERINDVGELHVRQGDLAATLRLDAVGWGVVERSGYPATFETVKQTLLALAELEILEPKTARPENFARLGVEDPEAADASSTLLRVTARDGQELAAVIVGEAALKGNQSTVYVRPAGGNQTYACRGRLTPDADPMGWLEREVLRLPSDRVARARLLHADGEEVLLRREEPGSNTFVLENVPPGRKGSFAGAGNQIATSLSYLSMEDVRRADEVDLTLEPVGTATFVCGDGLVVALNLGRFEDGLWATLDCGYEAPESGEPDPAPEGEAEAGAEEDPAEVVRKEARKIGRKVDGWAFKLPDFKSESLTKRMADLTQEEEPPAALAAPEEPAVEDPPIEDATAPANEGGGL